jgi:uncharacterized membrane protein YkoI
MEVTMERVAISLGLVAILLLAGANQARSAEKKIEKSAMPKPVLDAMAKKYPTAKMIAFEQADENGKILYEVGIEQGGTKMDVELSADGKIVGEESVIKDSEVPAPVKAALAASKYKGWKVDKIEKVIKEEKTDDPVYEFVVKSKNKKFEVVFDKAGKITEEDDKSKEKGND